MRAQPAAPLRRCRFTPCHAAVSHAAADMLRRAQPRQYRHAADACRDVVFAALIAAAFASRHAAIAADAAAHADVCYAASC